MRINLKQKCIFVFKYLRHQSHLVSRCLPVKSHNHSAMKYVPPQVRRAEETLDDKKREELGRLKKMVNGLINR